jgi:signal peptidase I
MRKAKRLYPLGPVVRSMIARAILPALLLAVLNAALCLVRVHGPSMSPNVNEGDYLVMFRRNFLTPRVRRGDIVLIENISARSGSLVKRIVGVPGDRIEVMEGSVYVNSCLLCKAPVPHEFAPPPAIQNTAFTLRANFYFVTGDNFRASLDSRMFGPIHRDKIKATSWVRVKDHRWSKASD